MRASHIAQPGADRRRALPSKKTVQNNVSTLYRKLKVSSRPEAVAKGLQLRLIAHLSNN